MGLQELHGFRQPFGSSNGAASYHRPVGGEVFDLFHGKYFYLLASFDQGLADRLGYPGGGTSSACVGYQNFIVQLVLLNKLGCLAIGSGW